MSLQLFKKNLLSLIDGFIELFDTKDLEREFVKGKIAAFNSVKRIIERDSIEDGRKRNKDVLDEMLELIGKYGKWTCNEHETCDTCPYYHKPCELHYKKGDKNEDYKTER